MARSIPVTASAEGAADRTDEDLMLAFQAGDAGAFDTLYGRYRGRLFRFLAREAGSREAGEEIYQEAWLRVIRARADYRVEARFGTWLFRIAHHCLIDHLRRQGRLWQHEEARAELPDDAACPLPTPEAEWERQATAQALARCLDALPLAQREVFLLREEAGLALAEIAAIAGCGLEAAKSRLRYALARLRQCLEATA